MKALGRRLRQLEGTLGPEVKASSTDTPVLPRLPPFGVLTTTAECDNLMRTGAEAKRCEISLAWRRGCYSQ